MNGLIVHVPKGFASESWAHNYINIMPMGVFSVASHACAAGHDVMVMNAAVYRNREDALELICRRAEERRCRVVGFTLHWHFQARDVLWAVERVKERLPDVWTVAGGVAASIYPRELLGACPALDFVVQGDGEEPFYRLLDELSRHERARAFESVPNLHFRGPDGSIASNPVTFVADARQLAAYDFSLRTLYDVSEYANGAAMVEVIEGDSSRTENETLEDKWFFLNVGRGCNLDCIYCSGCSRAFARYFNRKGVVLRPVHSVVKTVADAHADGFRTIHISFDPPFRGRDRYFAELFESIRRDVSDDLKLVFEPYRIPPRDFIESCARSFSEVAISLSPCFYDEGARARLKGYRFTDDEMRRGAERIASFDNAGTFIFYTICGVDDWRPGALERNVETMNSLSRELGVPVFTYPMVAEPGSPWVSFPELFGEHAMRLGFEDFWELWSRPLDRWEERLVYGMEDVNEVFARVRALTENAPFCTALQGGRRCRG
jgi:hypothetical protein